jgi:hypothetical protein
MEEGRRSGPDDYYARLVRDPSQWQDRARDLIWAANRLRHVVQRLVPLGFGKRALSATETLNQRHHSDSAVILLYSFAAENMLKAIWIAKGFDPLGPSGSLKREFGHHNLSQLARSAGVEGMDVDVLSQVTEFVQSGKYPAGRGPNEGWGAHGYFPDVVLSNLDALLQQMEESLAATGNPSLHPPIDLRLLGVRRKKPTAKTGRSDQGGGPRA